MDYILEWSDFFQDNQIKLVRIFQRGDKLFETVISSDPKGDKNFKEDCPPTSAYLNLPLNEVTQLSNDFISENKKINFYPLYFTWGVKPIKKINVPVYYRDLDTETSISIYEIHSKQADAVFECLNDDNKHGIIGASSEYVIFKITGHSRSRQWRHGYIQDRNFDNPQPFQISDLDDIPEENDERDFYYNMGRGIKHLLPRIPTSLIVDAAKKIFAQAVDKNISKKFDYTEKFCGEVMYQNKKLYMTCTMSEETFKGKNIYVFTIISLIWHPKGFEPEQMWNVSKF